MFHSELACSSLFLSADLVSFMFAEKWCTALQGLCSRCHSAEFTCLETTHISTPTTRVDLRTSILVTVSSYVVVLRVS